MSATQATPGLFDNVPNVRRHFASIQDQFEAFHRENPLIYKYLVDRARQVKARGRKNYSIKTLWELLRWHVDTQSQRPGDFKLNNNYASRYARLIMQREPDLAGFFNTRGLRA